MTESELCERYLPLLRAFARRRVRDRVEADELAQETLFVVIRALREGRVCSREKLGAYVLGVGRNLVREGYRRDRRARELVVGLAPLAAGEAEAPRVEHHQRLRQCMSRLTPTARAVLQQGRVLGIFPEGGLSRDGLPMLGSPGAVSLVLQENVPIVPVGILGAHAAMPPGAAWPRPRRITIRFGAAMLPAEFDAMGGGDRRVRLREATATIMRRIAALTGQTAREDALD